MAGLAISGCRTRAAGSRRVPIGTPLALGHVCCGSGRWLRASAPVSLGRRALDLSWPLRQLRNINLIDWESANLVLGLLAQAFAPENGAPKPSLLGLICSHLQALSGGLRRLRCSPSRWFDPAKQNSKICPLNGLPTSSSGRATACKGRGPFTLTPFNKLRYVLEFGAGDAMSTWRGQPATCTGKRPHTSQPVPSENGQQSFSRPHVSSFSVIFSPSSQLSPTGGKLQCASMGQQLVDGPAEMEERSVIRLVVQKLVGSRIANAGR